MRGWKTSGEGAVFAMLPEGEAAQVEALQTACREAEIPLAGALCGARGDRRRLRNDGRGALSPLALADIVMPRMRGPEVAAKIRERRPSVRAVFPSGCDDQSSGEALSVTHPHVLARPYTADGLCRAVRDALDQRRDP